MFYLAITVLATITLYYELYVGGSVSTLLLVNLHMSFTFYVVTVAFGALIGAFGSLFAGLTDRFGRANLVVFGLLFTGVFVAFIMPAATSKWPFTIESFVVAFVEGMCLVATPALIRDFSPQVGRATAMGFWTSGPVLGSLIVAVVGSATIPAVVTDPQFWTHEYHICRHRRAGRVRDRVLRAEGAVPAAARPADGDHARPRADRGPGQGHDRGRHRGGAAAPVPPAAQARHHHLLHRRVDHAADLLHRRLGLP